jgi:hypothetical protein
MTRPVLYYLTPALFLITWCSIFPEFIQAIPAYPSVIQQNPSDKRLLLNGRIWRNQYSKAIGDQFFLTNTFLKGSVTFNGRKFNNLDLQYDITNDELLLSVDSYPVIIMNKEMVDSFSLVFENRNYDMINAGTDSSSILKGYVNVLYNAPSALYIKYIKKFQPLAVDGRYDIFYEENHIYLRKGTEIVPVTRKSKLINLLQDKKKEIRHFLKSNRLRLIQKNPGTFVPVLKYYDSIRK